MTTTAPRKSGGIGKPSTADTVASNDVPGKILESRYPLGFASASADPE
jgi:hypothetical protein